MVRKITFQVEECNQSDLRRAMAGWHIHYASEIENFQLNEIEGGFPPFVAANLTDEQLEDFLRYCKVTGWMVVAEGEDLYQLTK